MPPKKKSRVSDPGSGIPPNAARHPDLDAHLARVHAAVKAINDHPAFNGVFLAQPLTIAAGGCHMSFY